ncbi:MAG: gluconate 2-dehydrogenase subunit 3 family protein [Anaerolineales bacterium]|nr:gluconate 2-dehydrogenase subunit 3 family protein [Anaerolineales bacterium]|tara:strand:+ start:3769 stop:4230 length:462 start_codon:yes stop_codon:yes gene_type:complete
MDIKELSENQKNLISNVLDCLIPPDGVVIGAGEAGIVNYICSAMSTSHDLNKAIRKIISVIQNASMTQYESKFELLAQDNKIGILTYVEKIFPHYFEILVEHTYKGYYSNKDVLSLLGVGATPPQPRGYILSSFDKNMLKSVRRMGNKYRNQE